MRLLTAALLSLAVLPASAQDARIALLGDSTVITSYLPAGERHHQVLQKALSEALPGKKVAVVNWADNGEFIPRYLLNGVYDRQRKGVQKLDAAIIRFGINDQKYSTPEGFKHHLETLIDLLSADYPGITIFLETGPFVDYPARYEYDREAVLSKYWAITRQVAEERKLTLIDFHAASERETKGGNWDQRIRLTERPGEPRVFDNRYDEERGNQRWFSDIHPNQNGVKIAVDTELPPLLALLKTPPPLTLPSKDAPPKAFPEPRNYAELLDFAPERLDRNRNRGVPQDRFQKSTQPQQP